MVKEALVEATNAKKISLYYDESFSSDKPVSFHAGTLRLHCNAKNFYRSMDKYAKADVTSLL